MARPLCFLMAEEIWKLMNHNIKSSLLVDAVIQRPLTKRNQKKQKQKKKTQIKQNNKKTFQQVGEQVCVFELRLTG